MTGCSATVCKFGAELCSTRCGLFLNLPKRPGNDLRIPGKGTDVLDNGILDLLSRERLAGAGVPPALLGGTTNIVPIPPPALRGVRVMHGDPAGVAMEQPCAGGRRTCSVPPPAAHRRPRICPRETPAQASSPSGPKQRFSGRKK